MDIDLCYRTESGLSDGSASEVSLSHGLSHGTRRLEGNQDPKARIAVSPTKPAQARDTQGLDISLQVIRDLAMKLPIAFDHWQNR
jgi:hypothetical protein